MRVLWFSVTPSLYDETKHGGWIASLEKAISDYAIDNQLGIAFESDKYSELKRRANVIYYPMYSKVSVWERARLKFFPERKWNCIKSEMLKIIDEFNPDIIQCFGTEWPYGAIANEINIPVVIHMQGFLNIYYMSGNMAMRELEYRSLYRWNLRKRLSRKLEIKRRMYESLLEKKIMNDTRYFMGRTKWDKDIVKYYAPDAKYYYCSEALRPEIMAKIGSWRYPTDKKTRLVTITQAGVLKGNEIILRTAEILMQFNFDFEWDVAGNSASFIEAERITGINHNDVKINLIGMIDATQVASKLANSKFYIHPAIIDNSPNSLCEAQMIGCPVITSFVGGIPDLVTDEKTGFFYPYNEPHTLAFTIMNLADNMDLLKEVSINECRTAQKRHDPNAIVDELLKIYELIIQDNKKVQH